MLPFSLKLQGSSRFFSYCCSHLCCALLCVRCARVSDVGGPATMTPKNVKTLYHIKCEAVVVVADRRYAFSISKFLALAIRVKIGKTNGSIFFVSACNLIFLRITL